MNEYEIVKETTSQLLKLAVTRLPEDIISAIKKGYEIEKGIAKKQLEAILENIELAEKENTPICQDTGLLLFYVKPGKMKIEEIERGIIDGVKEATKKIPLRPNAVHPITRENSGNNVGKFIPWINYKFDSEYTEICVLPKGAGSENMSALALLTPSAGLKGIKEFVLNTVLNAGGNPCPPTIVGVGIGGTADIANKLAKESVLRPLNERHKEEVIAKLEMELYNALNATGIGPMGLGGKTTVLGVNAEYAYCHTATNPVAVNIQCWCARKAIARISDGNVEYISHRVV
ncbi:MAG: fumarate hydratase [Candidatus Thermoplasmatota archaeon]